MSLKQPSSSDDDTRFDRLVDGDLDAEEYRHLIASLDDEPGGWRRCALAFLETQAWNEEFRELCTEGQSHCRAGTARTLGHSLRSVSVLLAMAASFFVAFGLGVGLRSWWPTSSAGPVGPMVVDNQSPHPSGLGKGDPTARVEVGPALAENNLDEAVPERRERADRPLGHVRLVVEQGDGSAGKPIDVPFFDLNRFDPHWLNDDMFSLPPDVLQSLQRLGHQIRRDQRFVPINLQDGRRVVIPVEEVEIFPVGSKAFH